MIVQNIDLNCYPILETSSLLFEITIHVTISKRSVSDKVE